MNRSKDEAASSERPMADSSSEDSDASYEFLDSPSSDSSQGYDCDSYKDKEENQAICSSINRVDVANKLHEKKLPGTKSRLQDTLEEVECIEVMWKMSDELVEAMAAANAGRSFADDDSINANETTPRTTQTSASETPCAISTQTESLTTCAETQTPVTQPEVISNPIKRADKLKTEFTTSHTFDMFSDDMTIKFLFVKNEAMKSKIERLEKQLNNRFEARDDRCSTQRNVDDYLKKAEEMNNCFMSSHYHYVEVQQIIGDCINLVRIIENSSFVKSMTENNIADFGKTLKGYRKNLTSVQVKVMDDRQTMISVEKQYEKILSDYTHLVHELNSVKFINKRMILIEKEKQRKHDEMEQSLDEREKRLSEEKAALIKQQEILSREKVQIHEAMINSIRTLVEEKEKLLASRKTFEENIDRIEKLHESDLEKPTLNKEVLKEQQPLQQRDASQPQNAQQKSVGVPEQTTLLLSQLLATFTRMMEILKQQQALMQQSKPQNAQTDSKFMKEQTPLSLSYFLENLAHVGKYDLKTLQALLEQNEFHQQNAQPASVDMQQQIAPLQITVVKTAATFQSSSVPVSSDSAQTTRAQQLDGSQIPRTVETSQMSSAPASSVMTVKATVHASADASDKSKGLPNQAGQSTLSGDRTVIWRGMLEYEDKSKVSACVEVPFLVSQDANNGQPEVNADSWPKKLTMHFVPSTLIGSLGQAYLKYTSVLFTPSPSNKQAVKALLNVMSNVYVGLVYLPSTPSCNINVLLLYYTAEKRTFNGYIPTDQQAYVARLMKVIFEEKSAHALATANFRLGASPTVFVTNRSPQQSATPTTTQQNQIKPQAVGISAAGSGPQGQTNTGDGQITQNVIPNNGLPQQSLTPKTMQQDQNNTQAVGISTAGSEPQAQIKTDSIRMGQQQETLKVVQEESPWALKNKSQEVQQAQNGLNPSPGIQKPLPANAQPIYSGEPIINNDVLDRWWNSLRAKGQQLGERSFPPPPADPQALTDFFVELRRQNIEKHSSR